MSKFQRILWTINGILILGVLLFVGYKLIDEEIRRWSYSSRSPEIIVGQELREAKDKGLILQGLDYDSPLPVYGSSGYILPVRVKTYDRPRNEGEFSLDAVADSYPKLSVEQAYDFVNLIFTNSNFEEPHVLLDKKAFIASFRYPTDSEECYNCQQLDTSIQFITYSIALEDSNKDERLDNDDNSDLYITDLRGNNLVQVTKEIDVSDYKFLNSNELLIEYYNRDKRPQEYKRKYFIKYFIKEGKLQELSSLHQTLDNLEKTITK